MAIFMSPSRSMICSSLDVPVSIAAASSVMERFAAVRWRVWSMTGSHGPVVFSSFSPYPGLRQFELVHHVLGLDPLHYQPVGETLEAWIAPAHQPPGMLPFLVQKLLDGQRPVTAERHPVGALDHSQALLVFLGDQDLEVAARLLARQDTAHGSRILDKLGLLLVAHGCTTDWHCLVDLAQPGPQHVARHVGPVLAP
eukprot:9329120-Pyramimonas_sp.AAC.1